jgi:hypothetical protein
MALNPTGLYDLAETILACVCAELTATSELIEGQPGCPSRACVVPGAVAWDGCDGACDMGSCGQLSVSIARIYAATNFPEQRVTVVLPGCYTCPSEESP